MYLITDGKLMAVTVQFMDLMQTGCDVLKLTKSPGEVLLTNSQGC